jgi:ribosomal-protein-alanine N-acetyltransferase
MTAEDIKPVMELTSKCFDDEWTAESFKNELANNVTCYIVAKYNEIIIGFMGAWFIVDEAHIITVAVDPEYRKLGLGNCLVWQMLNLALEKQCRWATLEVSTINIAALKLYEKFGFKKISERKDYYAPGEDAIIMWTGNMNNGEYKELTKKIRIEMEENICLYLV